MTAVLGLVAGLALVPGRAAAGPIFLTGHDPDFHGPLSPSTAGDLLTVGLQFATGGLAFDTTSKFLWVESRIAVPGGHRVGELGLTALGLTLGTHYDRANAAEFATLDLSGYEAIAIASSFGGLLTRAELDALIARSTDIAAFVNTGGGILALAECFPSSPFCDGSLLAGPTAPSLFGFLPIAVSSVATAAPYTVTAFGAGLGLTNADVNDPTHNSFGLVGGLSVVDVDSLGVPTTLAGVVRVDDGGLTPVPEPATLGLLGIGLLAAGRRLRRRSRG